MWGICEYKIKQDSKIFETVNIGAKIPNFLRLRNRSKEEKFLPRSSEEKTKQKLEGVKGGKKRNGMKIVAVPILKTGAAFFFGLSNFLCHRRLISMQSVFRYVC